jgi:hypothetical protein
VEAARPRRDLRQLRREPALSTRLSPDSQDHRTARPTLGGNDWEATRGTPGTSLSFPESEVIGEEDALGRRLWSLSEVLTPYGTSGYIPAVSARFSSRGRLLGTDVVSGFEFYIGAGGD